MSTDITILSKLFEAVQSANQKQISVIEKLQAGKTDEAIRTAYPDDVLKSSVHNYYTSLAVHGPNFLKGHFVASGAKKFADEFAEYVSEIGVEVKKEFEKAAEEYLGCPAKYKDGSVIVYGNPIASKAQEMEEHMLHGNRMFIENGVKMEEFVESKVHEYSNQIQAWFTEQVLVHENDYTVTKAVGHELI